MVIVCNMTFIKSSIEKEVRESVFTCMVSTGFHVSVTRFTFTITDSLAHSTVVMLRKGR